jgi:predicted enzyme related to lactoylglutathione lyase
MCLTLQKAGEWYVAHLAATPTQTPGVFIGKTLIRFAKGQRSRNRRVDHIGLSFGDLPAKLKELEAAGAKITTPFRDVPGLFQLAFVEDPWGVRIDVLADPETLGFHHVHLRGPDPKAS